jgi:antitoxin VapB
MALHIRDPRDRQAARELAELQGAGITEAVRSALEDKLSAERKKLPLMERIKDITDRIASYPSTGLEADKAFYDHLTMKKTIDVPRCISNRFDPHTGGGTSEPCLPSSTPWKGLLHRISPSMKPRLLLHERSERGSRPPAKEVEAFLQRVGISVLPVDAGTARLALGAQAVFGKVARHPAKLNMGDCFAYAMAKAARGATALQGR